TGEEGWTVIEVGVTTPDPLLRLLRLASIAMFMIDSTQLMKRLSTDIYGSWLAHLVDSVGCYGIAYVFLLYFPHLDPCIEQDRMHFLMFQRQMSDSQRDSRPHRYRSRLDIAASQDVFVLVRLVTDGNRSYHLVRPCR